MTNPNILRISPSCIDNRGQLLETHTEVEYPTTKISADRLRWELLEAIAEPFNRLHVGVVNGTVPWRKS